jgi:hypothetical protein
MKKLGLFLGGAGKTVAHVEGICVQAVSMVAIIYSTPDVNGGSRFRCKRISDKCDRVVRMIRIAYN